MALTQKRKQVLRQDQPIVEQLYRGACQRFGPTAVCKDMGLLWTWRCIQGMQDAVPFTGGMEARTLAELLYVAREVCGLPRDEEV